MEWRVANDQRENILAEGKNMINNENLIRIHRKENTTNIDEPDENSLVETIEERLKTLRTNEIDARIEARIPGRKRGGRAGKTKGTWRWMKQTPLRKLRIDLANVEMIGST